MWVDVLITNVCVDSKYLCHLGGPPWGNFLSGLTAASIKRAHTFLYKWAMAEISLYLMRLCRGSKVIAGSVACSEGSSFLFVNRVRWKWKRCRKQRRAPDAGRSGGVSEGNQPLCKWEQTAGLSPKIWMNPVEKHWPLMNHLQNIPGITHRKLLQWVSNLPASSGLKENTFFLHHSTFSPMHCALFEGACTH